MDPANFSELRKWLTEAGLAGTSETALLDGFCRRAFEAGLPLARATVIIDTLDARHLMPHVGVHRVMRDRVDSRLSHNLSPLYFCVMLGSKIDYNQCRKRES